MLTPINAAEAVFEPFWDPEISELASWKKESQPDAGLSITQEWNSVAFSWEKAPEKGSVFQMARAYLLDISGYDVLVIAAVLPRNSRLEIRAVTDRGSFSGSFGSGGKVEGKVPLGESSLLRAVEIKLFSTEPSAAGWLNWIGLENTAALKRHTAQWEGFSSEWAGYLKPLDYEPAFSPYYGIAITGEELSDLCRRYESEMAETGSCAYKTQAAEFLHTAPETQIREYLRFWRDSRFSRTRDNDQYMLNPGTTLLYYALLAKDKKALRLAARYALSLCMIPNWREGFVTRFPGGLFDHRCFVQSLALTELSIILDGAGDFFTPLGRRFVLRRMMEEGLAAVNATVWKHEYIFDCNQLAWFSAGRLLGYGVLSREFPRMASYLTLAYEELCESVRRVISRDGSTVEGMAYFLCQPAMGCSGIYYGARAMGKSFRSLVPDKLFQTAAYADALWSTDHTKAVITVCDCSEPISLRGLAVMAYLLPDSLWVNLYHQQRGEDGLLSGDPLTDILSSHIPARDNRPLSFHILPEAGYLSSVRRSGDGALCKVFVMGNRAGAGHTHEDKGSFVLEFGGETFATDPGKCEYDNPLSLEMPWCQRHNMLIPQGTGERPHPEKVLSMNVYPEGMGDGKTLHVLIDLTESFGAYYARWVRTLDSDAPESLMITDDYALKKGNGVGFYLNTKLPCRLEDGLCRIVGRYHTGKIVIPEGCRAEVHTLSDGSLSPMNQLRIYQSGTEGRLCVQIRWEK